MKKLFSFVLLITLILSAFVSCSGDSNENTPQDNEKISGIDISEYKIVRPDNSTFDFLNYIKLFKSEMLRITKKDLTIATDYDSTGEGVKEILIGETNRAASVKAMKSLEKAPANAYTIQTTDDKIVIAAKSDEGVIRAMKYFLVTYAKGAAADNFVTIEANTVDNGTIDLNSIIFDNYTELSTQVTSIIATSGRNFAGTGAYETLIELSHNGESNGTLFASFATYSENGYRIYKSTDKGKSWEHISTALDNYNNMVTGPENPIKHEAKGYCLQPCLFELPKDMGSFKEGTLFLGACTTGTGYYKGELVETTTSMTLYYSEDLGKTWTAYVNVDLAGNDPDDTGVWEPYFVFEEETGRVYCFYSDESDEANDKHGVNAQKLVYKYSTDMKTWVGKDGKTGVTDEPFIVVNSTVTNSRPGMISIAKMGNGEYFMTYEVCGLPNGCPIYYRKTTDLASWPEPSDLGTLVVTDAGKTLGSAPWCAWTPAGGECGTLFVIGEYSTLFISFDYGETFTAITNPMYQGQTSGTHGKSSYSPFLGFSPDGTTLYYLDNPQDVNYPGTQHIMFKSIRIR